MTLDTEEVLARLVGPGIGIGAEPVSGESGLRPEEADALRRAVPHRVPEFAAGRRAARKALASIGRPEASLPVGPDRSPVWPEGTCGSISHDAGLALAAAAPTADVHALGIDLTEAAPLPEDLSASILRHPDEEGMTGLEARAAFSAKETLFKTLAPQVGFVFGFAAAAVRIDLEGGRFEARLEQPLGRFMPGHTLTGSLAIAGPRLITVMVLRAG